MTGPRYLSLLLEELTRTQVSFPDFSYHLIAGALGANRQRSLTGQPIQQEGRFANRGADCTNTECPVLC